MKKTNNIKLLVLAISLALLICGIVGVSVSAETASEPAANADASLSIYKKNVSFQNAPQLVFAVGYENLDPATVTLDVWYGEKSGEATTVTSFGNVTVDGKTYPAFAVDPAEPKYLDETVYVQAKVGDVVSDVERYSILEFAWAGIMTSTSDAAAADYYNIIDYSASVQKWLTASGKFDGTPVGNYFYVRAEGVALDGEYDSGIFTSPVTFTLGESALGWNVTTYANGTKTTETKAAGDEITASASTICTKIEAIKPQQVAGTPLDFEDLTLNEKFQGGAGTTFFSGYGTSEATRTEERVGITETTGKDGTSTKAYYVDSNDKQDFIRIQSLGDDAKAANLASANAVIFDTDIKIDFVTANKAIMIYFGDTSGNKDYAYWTTMRLDANTQTIKFLDSGAGGNGAWVQTDLKSGDWFKLRIEYYKISADELLVLTFVNGELIYTSNRPHVTNANGDDAWPIYSTDFTSGKGNVTTGINAIHIGPDASTDATMYLDNTLLRITTLTPPTIPVSDYTSYYTAN